MILYRYGWTVKQISHGCITANAVTRKTGCRNTTIIPAKYRGKRTGKSITISFISETTTIMRVCPRTELWGRLHTVTCFGGADV